MLPILYKTHGIFLRILFLSSFAGAAIAQNAVMLPWTPQQFTNTNGTPLVAGKVCSFLGGTSTGTATFTDSTASVSNAIPPNAILLDSTGRPTSGGIWLTPNKAYKIVTMTAGSDNTCSTGVVIKTQDNVLANNGFTLSFPETAPPGSLAATGFDVCYGDTASHGIKCNYNNAGFSSLPLVGFVNTWTANQLFGSGNLLPSVAGGTDVGSTSLPFGNAWLGTAATNNFKVQPGTTTGARIITITDPVSPTTVGLPLTIASGTATMTTALIASLACGTVVTVPATGVATTDSIFWNDNAQPAAATNGVMTIKAWPTTGNVNFFYCNPTAGGVTPAAATLNWRVAR